MECAELFYGYSTHAYKKKYYWAHQEEIKAYRKEYRKIHKAELRIIDKRYYEENKEKWAPNYKNNKEKRRAYNVKYYQEHKERMNTQAKEWVENHPDGSRAIKNRWALKNRERILERMRIYSHPQRQIWENHFRIEIPKGYDAHHKDCNPTNNEPNNLLCLPHDEHAKLHWIKDREGVRPFR